MHAKQILKKLEVRGDILKAGSLVKVYMPGTEFDKCLGLIIEVLHEQGLTDGGIYHVQLIQENIIAGDKIRINGKFLYLLSGG